MNHVPTAPNGADGGSVLTGPRWVRLHGLIRYQVQDVENWIKAAPAGGGQA